MDETTLVEVFGNARLKVYRANRHISEIEHWFNEYVESDFYDIVNDLDPQSGQQILRVNVAPICADLPLAIGDAFHCLSSALDYVMSGLMKAKTGSSKRISFPSDETRKALRKSFMPTKPDSKTPPNRRVAEAFPLIALQILTVVKPYRGGNFCLWEVRKADNIDKHNIVIPSLAISHLEGVDLTNETGTINHVDTRIQVAAGHTLDMLAFPAWLGPIKIKNKGRASCSVKFPDALEVFAGEPVLPTLTQCSQLVSQAIDKIEAVARRYI